jgi:FKBP-type peptidyl-prolyl cis-trans isomerase FkpA
VKASQTLWQAWPGLVLATSACAAGPETSASGLVYESLKDGAGPSPKATDVVKVNYRGTFPDSGKEFDSSYKRGQPIDFRSIA